MVDITFETVNGVVYIAELVKETETSYLVKHAQSQNGGGIRIPNLKNRGHVIETPIEFFKDKLIWVSRQ